MEWLRLVAPSAAVLALFLGVGLLVQSIRQGRAIRRLEQRLAEGEGRASRASLERIAALQTRASVSSGASPGGGRTRVLVLGSVALVVVVLAGAGAWWMVGRDGGDGDPAAQATQPGTTTAKTTTSGEPPPDGTSVPAEVEPLQNKSQYEVSVLNASGVSQAAGGKVMPAVVAEGYTEGYVGDAFDGTTDLQKSIVMYTEGNEALGDALASDLGIDRAVPLSGITVDQVEGADAVVIVGLDLAG